jgi:hypothetical protein
VNAHEETANFTGVGISGNVEKPPTETGMELVFGTLRD